MPRLFISHSSKDNVEALAFRNWLVANGWAESDVFIDLHGIGAGERWRETLRKANVACKVVVFLASENSLASVECEKELELAKALEKHVIPVIVRDLSVDHPKLAPWSDQQIVDLSAQPTERMEPFEFDGRMQRPEFSTKALASIKASLKDLDIAPGSFSWKPPKPEGGPYPGLAAFGEGDAGIFFGREADIADGLAKLRLMRRRRASRLLVVQAASGAGKSSYLRAGLWPRLNRDPDFAPLAILRPAQGILTGPEGIGRRIQPWFERHKRTKVAGDIEMSLTQRDRTAAVAALARLFADATEIATTVRRAGVIDARPPAPLIAIDQGEELFATENTAESDLFLELLASVFKDLPEDVDPYVLMTIRADSLEPLLQRWPTLGLKAPELQALPPLSPTAYRDVILEPAKVYSERVRLLEVEPALAAKLSQDATGGDALPLLAFTLEQLFERFKADGNLSLERYDGMGGIGGSIDRALKEAKLQAGATGSEAHLHRLIVPGLAIWDLEAGAAKRLVADEAALLAGDRAALKPLADAPVKNRLLTRGAGTLEVAHEALLRRPPISDWLHAQQDALKLRDDLLREAETWARNDKHNEDLVRRGDKLKSALDLAAREDFAAALMPARDYLATCRKLERTAQRNRFLAQAAIYTLLLVTIAGMGAYINRAYLNEQYFWLTAIRGHTLAAEELANLEPQDAFRECAQAAGADGDAPVYAAYSINCPEMVVVPAGSFEMGGSDGYNEPRVNVTIAQPFAVSKFEITAEQWQACVDYGGCTPGGGKGKQPVSSVNLQDAKDYAAWLSKMTGATYRLLSEAEWEYVTRAGTTTEYWWGNEIRRGDEVMAACDGCGSQWDNKQAAPVGSFPPNAFGLYDVHGNVWEWVEDYWHENYRGAPADGSVWLEGEDTSRRVVRGGSWDNDPQNLRSAIRFRTTPDGRNVDLGFRLARTLNPKS